MPHPPLAPRPDLRRHVVRARDAERRDRAQQPQGEARTVDRHHHVRPAARDVGGRLRQPPAQAGEVGQHLHQPHHRQLLHREQALAGPRLPSGRRRRRRCAGRGGGRAAPRSGERRARRRSPRRRRHKQKGQGRCPWTRPRAQPLEPGRRRSRGLASALHRQHAPGKQPRRVNNLTAAPARHAHPAIRRRTRNGRTWNRTRNRFREGMTHATCKHDADCQLQCPGHRHPSVQLRRQRPTIVPIGPARRSYSAWQTIDLISQWQSQVNITPPFPRPGAGPRGDGPIAMNTLEAMAGFFCSTSTRTTTSRRCPTRSTTASMRRQVGPQAARGPPRCTPT